MILDGFRPLAMRLPNDCGPVAMLQALAHLGSGVTYDELVSLWGFRAGVDRFDTPGRHLLVLRALGVPVAMRRRLGRERIERALGAGRPVVMLVPAGILRWHWVVVCGREGERLSVSPGDGRVVEVEWAGLAGLARARPEGRAFRVDGLGYCLGRPHPFEPDPWLERDLVRLAHAAEGALGPLEPPARLARGLVGRACGAEIGWRGAAGRGSLRGRSAERAGG